MMRQRFFHDLETLEAGGEPKAIIRDPEANRCVTLPIIGRRQLVEGVTRAELEAAKGFAGGDIPRQAFPYLYGQPDAVRSAYYDAMGFTTAK